MNLNWKRKIANGSLLLCLACNPTTEQPKAGLFERYYQQVFNEKPRSIYYIIVGSDLCGLCENNVFRSFRQQQKHIKSDQITLITDLPKKRLDTLFIEDFSPAVLVDSTRKFSRYAFPRSYVTIYKIEEGSIQDYVFFRDTLALKQFLQKEQLLN